MKFGATKFEDPRLNRYIGEGFNPGLFVRREKGHIDTVRVTVCMVRIDGETRTCDSDIPEHGLGVVFYRCGEAESDGTRGWHSPNEDVVYDTSGATKMGLLSAKVKAGQAIERALAKLEQIEGPVTTHGQMVNRLARVVGAKGVLITGFVPDRKRLVTLGEAVGYVDFEMGVIAKDLR